MTLSPGAEGPDGSPVPVVLANRYELLDLLGEGGSGRVHAARDRVTGARVAVKLVRTAAAGAWPRVRREVLALRLLRLPGVVPLLDDGVHEGTPFLVMEIAEGRPFPGAPGPLPWDALAPPALAFLEVLARVHAAGVVHRDLKPANVFVGASGGVTLLDFGLSWGPALGEAVTAPGFVVGTPEYLAPEQFTGAAGDARTDLYAVGVMLYAAITGRMPLEASDLLALITLKRSVAPVPLRRAAPDAPRDVAAVVDRLLAIDPADRPDSAGAVLRALFGGDRTALRAAVLPRIGPRAPLDALVRAATERRSADVHGPAGSGRTRLLADTADALQAEGRNVVWLVPSHAPFGSLAPLVGTLDDLRCAGTDEAVRRIRTWVEGALRDGAVVVADDPDRTDRWTNDLLGACLGAGTVLRVVREPTPGCVRTAELPEEDLRSLFAGPDRVFHFREDGARELWHRTGGLAARVAAEVAAWVRTGIAHWDGGKLVVTRASLDRLRGGLLLGDESLLRPGPLAGRSPELDELLAWIALAWPHASVPLLAAATGRPAWRLGPEVEDLEAGGMVRRLADGRVQPLVLPQSLQTWTPEARRAAHRAISRALPPGTSFRLRHLAAGGEPAEVVAEALVRAPELQRVGRIGDARVVLEIGLAAARAAGDPEAEERVLVAAACAALDGGVGSGHAVEHVLYEISRASRSSARLDGAARLLAAARDAAALGAGGPEEMLRRIDRIGSLEPEELEMLRQAERARLAARLPAALDAAVVRSIVAWAETTANPRARASARAWHALHLQRTGRVAEAARLHLEGIERTDRLLARVADSINATICLLDLGRVDEARETAARALEIAAECRHTTYEALAWSLVREIAYRLDEVHEPDEDLVDAAGRLGSAGVESEICIVEAAIAWRAGRAGTARDLASRAAAAAERDGNAGMRCLARALALACSGPQPADEVRSLADEACRANGAPETLAQALGLLALACPGEAAALRSRAAEAVRDAGPGDTARRLMVLSLDEALGRAPVPPPAPPTV